MFIIEVATPVDVLNFNPVYGPFIDEFTDCGEGPFDTRQDAEQFAIAEVGLPYRIVYCGVSQ